MENWVIELAKWIGAGIISLLLAEAWPTIKGFFKKGSISFNNWRIKATKEKYFEIKKYSENHSTLAVRSIKYFAKEVINIVIMFTFIGLLILASQYPHNPPSGFGAILISGYGGVIIANLSDIVLIIDSALGFDNYKERTKVRLKKLGGNPEALDKEETE